MTTKLKDLDWRDFGLIVNLLLSNMLLDFYVNYGKWISDALNDAVGK